jgi:DNA-binding NarL/FixJ family response regulator
MGEIGLRTGSPVTTQRRVGWVPFSWEDVVSYSVLIVDDEPAVLQLLTLLLELHTSLTVHGSASDGREALQQVQQRCPDAIICDIRMPGMDGLTAVPLLREACPEVVIVVYSSDPAARTALVVGADRVFDKATDAEEVLAAVSDLCRARGRNSS